MTKTGKQFEVLTKEIFELLSREERYTSVEHDVKLKSPEGERQIDILIRSKVCSLDQITIVECKDRNRPLGVEFVDAIHSKQQDVKAHHAVLVARKGFSKKAKRKADRLRITLCIARDAERKLRDVGLSIPVVVCEIHGIQLMPEYQVFLEAGTELTAYSALSVNDISIAEAFRNAILSGEIQPKATNVVAKWVPSFTVESAYIRDAKGQRLNIDKYALSYKIEVNYYFGYVNELPQTISMSILSQSKEHIFFKSEDLFDYKNNLAKLNSEEEVPMINGIHIETVVLPDIKFKEVDLSFKRIG